MVQALRPADVRRSGDAAVSGQVQSRFMLKIGVPVSPEGAVTAVVPIVGSYRRELGMDAILLAKPGLLT